LRKIIESLCFSKFQICGTIIFFVDLMILKTVLKVLKILKNKRIYI